MSLTPVLPPPPPLPGKCTSGTFLALPAMNCPLAAEQKFKENTVSYFISTAMKFF